jgi:hypothetical protein
VSSFEQPRREEYAQRFLNLLDNLLGDKSWTHFS